MIERIIYCIIGILLFLYGIRALVAGIKKEKKCYFHKDGYDGSKYLFKENYPVFINIAGGVLSIICGLGIVILYATDK